MLTFLTGSALSIYTLLLFLHIRNGKDKILLSLIHLIYNTLYVSFPWFTFFSFR